MRSATPRSLDFAGHSSFFSRGSGEMPITQRCVHGSATTTNSGITTYDGFHDCATGASNQAAVPEEMLETLLSRMDEVERDEFPRQQAHEWIRSPSRPGRQIDGQ